MTAEVQQEMVTIKIDGKEMSVPKGTLIIRAAEKAGVHIPRFCDHPLLSPVAACRQCLVEVASPNRQGVVAKMPKPQPACSTMVADQMEVYTAATSEVTEKAQRGVMEFLLINHPMDCPVCDKGGECPLQNQALSDGRTTSRFIDVKRTYPKPISVSAQILLDRDRCILCQRCTRFSTQIAGDAFVQLQGRGGGTPGYEVHHGQHGSQIGNFDGGVLDFASADATSESAANDYAGSRGLPGIASGYCAGPVGAAESDVNGHPFVSYFSGNIIQICPVGALTSASYRFRARPFDLVSVPSVTEHDASGSAIRVDYRHGNVLRRLALEDPEVNEDWITDKDRFAFRWQNGADRLRSPRVTGLENASWFAAVDAAATQLRKSQRAGVIMGGRLPLEDAYAYAKFARCVLGTNNIDFRTRAGSSEEDAFLGAVVAGQGQGVTYSEIEKAGHVLLVGLEAEEECGSIFLRLRKGVLAKSTSVSVISTFATRGTAKMAARFLPAHPQKVGALLDSIAESASADLGNLYQDLTQPESVILVGERAGDTPGVLSALLRLAARTGARLAWVPRRAGDRAAIEAGAMPNLLPGGRPVADADARAEIAQAWGVEDLPAASGLNTEQMLAAAAAGELDTLILAGVELTDLPAGAAAALERAFVIQLEVRDSDTAAFADVLFPVAPPVEKGGTFINWEGRLRPFGQVLTSVAEPDRVVLNDIAAEMGIDLRLASLEAAVKEYTALPRWAGIRIASPNVEATPVNASGIVLSTWKQMLDGGALQGFEPYLANTAHKAVALLSPATAQQAGITSQLRLQGPDGYLEFPAVQVDMPDGVVWAPQNAVGYSLSSIGLRAGAVVTLENVEVAK